MRVRALDFGEDSGITRLFCDACSKPVLPCWQGKYGEYCSRACLSRCDAERGRVKILESEKVKIPQAPAPPTESKTPGPGTEADRAPGRNTAYPPGDPEKHRAGADDRRGTERSNATRSTGLSPYRVEGPEPHSRR